MGSDIDTNRVTFKLDESQDCLIIVFDTKAAGKVISMLRRGEEAIKHEVLHVARLGSEDSEDERQLYISITGSLLGT